LQIFWSVMAIASVLGILAILTWEHRTEQR
jgi:hypothetical protein